MRLLHVLCSVLPVLGLSSPSLAAPSSHARPKHVESAKAAPAKAAAKLGKDKHAGKDLHGARDRKVAPKIERASVTRTEEKVRVELSLRGHGEPSDAELMEWLSHGAPRASKPASVKKDGGLEKASAHRSATPAIERASAHKSADKKSEKAVEKSEKAVEKSEKPSKAVEKSDKSDKVEKPSKPEKASDKKVSDKAAKIIADEKKKTEAVCMGPAIDILRGTETDKVALTRCDGKADEQGVLRLSVMARPGATARPMQVRREEDLGPFIKKVDKGLAERVATLSSHFASKAGPAAIEVISGYRPNSKGSYHSHARAMDIRVQGARNEDVVAFCKTLQDTGCGYYPNSGFVHVDVRDPGTGHISWIDASGPGETPKYVATWPAPKASDKDDAPETTAKAKTADTADKADREEPSEKSDAKAEANDKAIPPAAKAEDKAVAKQEAAKAEADKSIPATKPESTMKPSVKAKADTEEDLPKLPPAATGD